MKTTLKVTRYRNGDAIANVTGTSEWAGLSTDAYWNYDNDVNNIVTYGSLYNWYAVNDSRNIAPDGWNVPSDEEWKQIEMYLGMSQPDADSTGLHGTNEGSKLAGNAGLWVDGDLENNTEFGTSGFTTLPCGYRTYDSNFKGMGSSANFWCSTEVGSRLAWYRSLSYNLPEQLFHF